MRRPNPRVRQMTDAPFTAPRPAFPAGMGVGA
jgi:hypothetical protein